MDFLDLPHKLIHVRLFIFVSDVIQLFISDFVFVYQKLQRVVEGVAYKVGVGVQLERKLLFVHVDSLLSRLLILKQRVLYHLLVILVCLVQAVPQLLVCFLGLVVIIFNQVLDILVQVLFGVVMLVDLTEYLI